MRSRKHAFALGALALAVTPLASCAVAAPSASDAASSFVRGEDSAIAFVPCEPSPGATVPASATVECAQLELPLEWSKPEGRRIPFFLKRIRGSASGAHKQLWLLAGGPGASGDGFDYQATQFLEADPALDLYIPDHRGTGRSSELACPDVSAGIDACAADLIRTWGRDGLAAFSTTEAARDVGHLIERTREPQQEVHLYGISYGTYLAQRYLQIFPKQPTSVTLDGVCQAGLCSLIKYDYWGDRTAQKFLRECGEDGLCASKLGPDPIARVRDAFAVASSGGCAGLAGVSATTLQVLLGGFARTRFLRVLVPALTYRILRCDANDVVALQNFVRVAVPTPPPGGTGAFRIPALTANIAFSEMLEVPATTREDLRELMRSSVFASYSTAVHDQFDLWPRYEHDEYVGGYPDTDVPVLVLNGTLDPATPIEFAEEVAPHYARPHQTFVSLPRATHGTFHSSRTLDNTSCAFEIWKQFIAAPTKRLDTSCRERILPHDFAGTAVTARRFFGTDDIWENPARVSPKSAADAERDANLDDDLRRAREDTAPFAP